MSFNNDGALSILNNATLDEATLNILINDGVDVLFVGTSGPSKHCIFKVSEDRTAFEIYHRRMFQAPELIRRIELDDVTRCQHGQTTPNFIRINNSVVYKHVNKLSQRAFSMSILYAQGTETLDVVCQTQRAFLSLYITAKQLVQKAWEELKRLDPNDIYMRNKFKEADVDNSGSLNLEELHALVQSMNINVTCQQVESLYKASDTSGDGEIQEDEFVLFMNTLRRRPDLEFIWRCVKSNSKVNMKSWDPETFGAGGQDDESPLTVSFLEQEIITYDQFAEFLHSVQGEHLTHAQIDELLQVPNLTRPFSPHGNHEQHSQDSLLPTSRTVSFQQFFRYLTSSARNNVLDQMCTNHVYQDMTRPLSHYYINTSHNTYLEGDQLASNASVNRYIDDMMSGCRCVELDCWDGGADLEPIITHGGTLTGKILFKDVIKAVKAYAFKASDFPFILSFENHCSIPYQERMAHHLKNILGDLLASKAELATDEDGQLQLPSPHALRRKVLVKGKTNKHNREDLRKSLTVRTADGRTQTRRDHERAASVESMHTTMDPDDEDTDSDLDGEVVAETQANTLANAQVGGGVYGVGKAGVPLRKKSSSDRDKRGERRKSTAARLQTNATQADEPKVNVKRSTSSDDASSIPSIRLLSTSSTTTPDESSDISDLFSAMSSKVQQMLGVEDQPEPSPPEPTPPTAVEKKKETDKIAPELEQITFIIGTKFKSIQPKHLQDADPNEMHSIGENKGEKWLKKQPGRWSCYNAHMLTRTYPKGLRVDSSNYNPMPFWTVGCQMVALNFQTPGTSMQLNSGLFSDNGGCGFVLKPEELCLRGVEFNPYDELYHPTQKRRIVKIRVIGGANFPRTARQLAADQHHIFGGVTVEEAILDPYVRMDVYGVQRDIKSFKTTTVQDNGISPMWNEEFVFNLAMPEFAMFAFSVFAERRGGDDDLVAVNVVPFRMLRPGIRTLQLRRKDFKVPDDFVVSSLLLEVTIIDPSKPKVTESRARGSLLPRKSETHPPGSSASSSDKSKTRSPMVRDYSRLRAGLPASSMAPRHSRPSKPSPAIPENQPVEQKGD